MLSKYDEYPVHQAARPFAHIPSTDYSWDDGHYIGVFSADEKVFLSTGFRVNPNADVVGAYALFNVAGRQFTLRLSRCWRRQIDTVFGPLSFDFIEPLKALRLKLEANDSGLSFDIVWTGVSPAFEESHHIAEMRGRITTDQTRYSQPGTAQGWIQFEGRCWEVTPGKWGGARDHSWGLYSDRKPLGGHREWLPPRIESGVPRALHVWSLFHAGDWSGFYNLNESPTGEQGHLNDFHGTPFEGTIYKGWNCEPVHLVAATHKLRFQPGTRVLSGGTLNFRDHLGRPWEQRFEVMSPPWVPQTTGYTPGGWTDGGTIHTYHGNEELAMEWDDFDFSQQPFDYKPYPPRNGGDQHANFDTFRLVSGDKMQGVEFLIRTEIVDPEGKVHKGQGHLENFVFGRYDPYGFE